MRPFLNGVPRPLKKQKKTGTTTQKPSVPLPTLAPPPAAAAVSGGGNGYTTSTSTSSPSDGAKEGGEVVEMEVEAEATEGQKGEEESKMSEALHTAPAVAPNLDSTTAPPAASTERQGGDEDEEEEVEEDLLDLVGIVLRVRSLHYRSADDFMADVETLASQALRLGDGQADSAIMEAVDTLVDNGEWRVGAGELRSWDLR